VLLDGIHLVREARAAGVTFESVAIGSQQIQSSSEAGQLARALDAEGIPVYSVTPAVLDAMSPVRTPTGIVAIGRRRTVAAPDVCAQPNALVVAAVDVQDPGNMGSLVRAAEAAGASGVLSCGTSADPFSWKALRGSMGSALRLPIAVGLTVGDAFHCARLGGARMIAAVARGGQDPDRVRWQGPVMLLLGGEGPGLSEAIVAQCDERVTIPMQEPVESLNVAVAGAVLVYAARRQRV
jgi:TrmH family RNA methyltransferase